MPANPQDPDRRDVGHGGPGAQRLRTDAGHRHEPEKEKTRKGAGYGAAAGAVVGLLTAATTNSRPR